jgi:Fibronectin type III domain
VNQPFLRLVPSAAPENPTCNVLSSTSIYVTWSPPPPEHQNGKIRGYKVAFTPTDEYYDRNPTTTISTTTNQYYTIENAKKYTNYTIYVRAFTSVGDGTPTKDFICLTNEDCECIMLLFLYMYVPQSSCLQSRCGKLKTRFISSRKNLSFVSSCET